MYTSLIANKPYRPAREHFDYSDVYKVARATFSDDHLLDLDGDDPWEEQTTDNRAQGTSTPWDDINIKIFGEVSFSHTITHPANGKLVGFFLGTIVNGRVDRGIESRPPSRSPWFDETS
jgi:hypothetical protein